MAIYDRPVRILMREMIDQLAPTPDAVFTRQDALNWFREHYPKVKEGTVSAHLLRFSTNARSRHHYSPRPDEAQLYQLDGGRFRLHDPQRDPAPLTNDGSPPDDGNGIDDDAPDGDGKFAYESDLRDFLARNLTLIEPGLQLYEDEGITGVEFPVGGRFADILGVDAKGRLVVIELKVSRGYDRVIGQLLRYMAWIREHQAEPGQGVRGDDHRARDQRGPQTGLLQHPWHRTVRVRTGRGVAARQLVSVTSLPCGEHGSRAHPGPVCPAHPTGLLADQQAERTRACGPSSNTC